MMGRREEGQGQFFYSFDLDKVVPPDHLVRQIDGLLDLSWVHKELAPYYSHTGRPSIDPVLMIRMLMVGYVFALRSVAYVDYVSMEFLLAASLSDGHCGPSNNMLEMYNSGDPYLAFAKSVGAVPQSATKTIARKRSRSLQGDVARRAIRYVDADIGGSAQDLGVRSREMLAQHHSQFAQYWSWSDDYIQHAMQTGVVQTAFGWTHHVGIVGATNERSLRNWLIQSTGADILRISCILAARHGIKLLGSVHDAVLIEAPIERIEADVALMQEIMRRASRIVLNATAEGTHELRTDAKIWRYPEHFTDPRGDQIFEHVLELLAAKATTKRRA